MTVLDRHTLQLKQLNGAVNQLSTAISQQGDNISFLLREQLGMKGDIIEMKGDIVGMKGDIIEMNGTLAGMERRLAGIEGQQNGMDGKLSQILQLLQKPS